MSDTIYLDNASTTIPIMDAILPFQNPSNYYNASNLYKQGAELKERIEYVKTNIKNYLHATEGEIFFTSGATESNNWVIQGLIDGYYSHNKNSKPHIITSSIEHDSILNVLKSYGEDKLEVTFLNVDEMGIVDLDELEDSIKENTILISIMYVNNEIGSIQPLYSISKIANKYNILFHTDATQCFGKFVIDVGALNIDFISFSAHKFFGPKGIGGLYIKNEDKYIKNLMFGGGQEKNKRPSTYNAPAILGLNNALNYSIKTYVYDNNQHCLELCSCLKKLLKTNFNKEDYRINSYSNNFIFNFSLRNIDTDSIIIQLGEKGIIVSTGSACNTGDLNPSHVLQEIGCPPEFINGAIRVSFNIDNTESELKVLIEELAEIYYKDRSDK